MPDSSVSSDRLPYLRARGRHGTPPSFYQVPSLADPDHLQPPLLISRFILNLRRAVHQTGGGIAESSTAGPWDASDWSAPGFRIPPSLVGNMGESLHAESGTMYVDSESDGMAEERMPSVADSED